MFNIQMFREICAFEKVMERFLQCFLQFLKNSLTTVLFLKHTSGHFHRFQQYLINFFTRSHPAFFRNKNRSDIIAT